MEEIELEKKSQVEFDESPQDQPSEQTQPQGATSYTKTPQENLDEALQREKIPPQSSDIINEEKKLLSPGEELHEKVQALIDEIGTEKAIQKQNIENKETVENQYNAKTIIIMQREMDEAKGSVEKFRSERGATELNHPKYKLDDLKEFHSFVQNNQGNRPLAYAIVLSLFSVVPVKELIRIVDALLKRLPVPKQDEAGGPPDDSYLSQWEILNMLGGEQGSIPLESSMGKISCQCIKFSEEIIQNTVLEHIWSSFPNMRAVLIDWLIDISHNATGFLLNQIVFGLAKLVILDFGFGVDYILPKLQEGPEYKLLSRLVLYLYQQPAQMPYMDRLLLSWLSTDRHPLWRLPYQLYLQLGDSQVHCSYVKKINKNIYSFIKKMIEGQEIERGLERIRFIGENITYSIQLRDTTAEILQEMNLYIKAEKKYLVKTNKMEMLGIIYYLLLEASYWEVDRQHPAMALVADVTDQQFTCCKDILKFLLSKPTWKSWLFELLSRYLSKVDQYKFSETRLFAYFRYLAFLNGKDSYTTVQQFLDLLVRHDCRIAEKISHYLTSIYQLLIERKKGSVTGGKQ